MKRYLLIAMLAIVSCAPDRILSTLDTAESCLQVCPDTSLALLRSTELPFLAPRGLRARHALLHTIALDKNYMDVTSDSIIAPAVKYYERRGTPDERFKTLYYLGRIRQNAGDKEAAMDCFIRATDLAPEVTDTLALARCYAAQGVIYADFYDYPNAIEANRKAAGLFLAAGNVNSYVNNLLYISDSYRIINDYEESEYYLMLAEQYKNEVVLSTLSRYYTLKIQEVDDFQFKDVLNEYLQKVPEEYVYWKSLTNVCLDRGMSEMVEYAMTKYLQYNEEYTNAPEYYATLANIYEKTDKHKDALDSYKQYIHVNDSIEIRVYSQNLKLIQERYEKDLVIFREKHKNLILLLTLLTCAGIMSMFVIFIRKKMKENKYLNELYDVAVQEKESLAHMLETSPSNDKEICNILSERMELLNEIILDHRLSHLGKTDKTQVKIENLLNDSKEYLSTIGMTYVVKNPDVVAKLKKHGLTTWEIGYCCLYVMGYNSKEISGIMQNNQVYKISSRIREKLGLEGGKGRLETYIKDLFAKG